MYLPDGTVRKLRRSEEYYGDAHELTFSCYQRLPLLNCVFARQSLINSLRRTREKHNLELWAYVIMPEHVHVLFRPRDPGYRIRTILQSIKQSVAEESLAIIREHNAALLAQLLVGKSKSRHRFWQPGGGYDRNVNQKKTALSIVEYIHNNPVKRGLVACPTDWPWSSAQWFASVKSVLLPMDASPLFA